MITAVKDGVVIDVRVLPRAAVSGVAGTRGEALLVRLHAPPVEGAANAELIEVLAAAFDVPRRSVILEMGEHSRHKRIRIQGIDVARATARLEIASTPRNR